MKGVGGTPLNPTSTDGPGLACLGIYGKQQNKLCCSCEEKNKRDDQIVVYRKV